MTTKDKLVAGCAVLVGFLLLYWRVLRTLVEAWWTDGNYSHGFLIVPIAAYFAWERRHQFDAAPLQPAVSGLVLVIASMLVLGAGVVGAELFLTRISIIGTIAGIVLFLFGWSRLRVLAFPISFLILMVPIPAIIFNQIAVPLQLLASRVGESALGSVNIPVLREGNVLVLASTSLEVADACSGIRSIVSLLTLGIIFGYFVDRRFWFRLVIAASTIPIAILTNAARVAATGIAVQIVGPSAAQGLFHELAGWAVFLVAFVLMLGLQRTIALVAPPKPSTATIVAAA